MHRAQQHPSAVLINKKGVHGLTRVALQYLFMLV